MEGIKAAMDTAKQVVTLSTSVVALTVSFLEKIVEPHPSTGRMVPSTLFAAWVVYGLAILCALWTMMALTGTLNAIDRRTNGLPLSKTQRKAVDAYGDNVRIPAFAMVLAFLVAIALTIGTGFLL